MSAELAEHFIIIKGYIDAKDEQQRAVYGIFMGIVSRRDMRYLRVTFDSSEVPKDTGYEELHLLLEKKAQDESSPAFARHEAELFKFFDMSRTLQGIARNLNIKHAEQVISRFCAEELQLKAVTFVEFVEASEAYIARFLPSAEDAGAEGAPVGEGEPAKPEEAADGGGERKDSRDFVVRCDPVLDPVYGVAMSELAVGSYVCTKLPEDSVFYKLFMNNLKGFDGIIHAQVSGVLVNELGTATVSMQLADGVSGVMRMVGRVKVKMAAGISGAEKKSFFDLQALPVEFVFGFAGVLVLLSVIGLVIYLTNVM